jgi:hypothetical protein
MSDPLGRRCAIVLLAAMAAALATGLLAWGPVPLAAFALEHADARRWLGIPNAFNVFASLPLLLAGWWGLRATRATPWPPGLQRAWTAFHACAMAAALLAALHHLNPSFATWLPATTAMSAGFAMLAAGALAERVDERLARPGALCGIGAAVLLAALWVGWNGGGDVRPVLLIEALPVLLLPAGAIRLPGAHTRAGDWVLMLAGYAAAKLADIADARLYAASGWIGGHALMHLLLAGVTAWLAYVAVRAGSVDQEDDGSNQRQASLNTAG